MKQENHLFEPWFKRTRVVWWGSGCWGRIYQQQQHPSASALSNLTHPSPAPTDQFIILYPDKGAPFFSLSLSSGSVSSGSSQVALETINRKKKWAQTRGGGTALQPRKWNLFAMAKSIRLGVERDIIKKFFRNKEDIIVMNDIDIDIDIYYL